VKAPRWNPDLAGTYDRVAEPYGEQFFDELARKPFDRELLDRFAARLSARGLVCDVGCGPGHVGRYLTERGVDVFGLDLSSEMVALARRRNPSMRFEQGDLRALGLPDASLAGIVAFYSLIHLERAEIASALTELARVLVPGGLILIAFHGGDGAVHADDWFGQGVSIDATLYRPTEMAAAMERAGFHVETIATRVPYDFEYQSTRVYAAGMKRWPPFSRTM
jgi:SAM-dependent methyltransferase